MRKLSELIERQQIAGEVSIVRWRGQFCIINHSILSVDYVDRVAMVTAPRGVCSTSMLCNDLKLDVLCKLRSDRGAERWVVGLTEKDKTIKCGVGVTIDVVDA